MPIQINTSVKDKEYPPYVVTVEREKIKDVARAGKGDKVVTGKATAALASRE